MAPKISITNDQRIDQLEEEQSEALKKALTLANPAHVAAVQQGRSTWGIPPTLQFFRQEGGALVVPRGFASELPRFGSFGLDDQRLALPEEPFVFSGLLREYQNAAVQAVLKRAQGALQAGTGAGKTVMALAIIAARRQPTLVLVHNAELLHQWRERSKQFLGIEAGLIGQGKFDVQPLTIGIVNTVRNRLAELTPYFGHVVVDECHRCPSAMFTECVDAFPAKYRLGLSATPYRRDGLTKVIGFFIGPLVHEVDAAHLREIGAILRPRVITRPTAFYFPRDAAEHYQEMMTALTQDEERNALIASDVIAELANASGTALVVSDRVAHLDALSAHLQALGVTMDLLTGKTPKAQREAIVARIQAGHVHALGSTVQLIGEGFDCPGLASLFLATPIKFSGRLLQVVGRILRPLEGKTPRLYDYLDPVGVLEASAKSRNRVYTEQGFAKEPRP